SSTTGFPTFFDGTTILRVGKPWTPMVAQNALLASSSQFMAAALARPRSLRAAVS
ncbi:hypothetical protein KEM55_006404, partial [Ascosphaera atra]